MTLLAVPLLAAALAAAPAAPVAPSAAPARVERQLLAMGTSLEISVEAADPADRWAALAASETAVAALTAVEERLSTWRPGSELSRLNAAPAGRPVALSPATLDELAAADACRRDTGGAFDHGIGALVAAWGLRDGGRVPGATELRRALAAGGAGALELDTAQRTAVRRHPELRLEEGGFGKGAGLAAAAAALAAAPAVRRALVDLGGQVALVGPGPWTVEVAEPRRRRRALVRLTLDGGSVATSGNSQRGIEVDGRVYGHLLDPETGRPVPDFGSVTVWATDPLRADCLSTALYVMGPRAALEWAAATPGVEALVAETAPGHSAAPRVRATAGLARRAVPAVEGVRVETYGQLHAQTRSDARPDEKRKDGGRDALEGRTTVLTDLASPAGDARIQEEYR